MLAAGDESQHVAAWVQLTIYLSTCVFCRSPPHRQTARFSKNITRSKDELSAVCSPR